MFATAAGHCVLCLKPCPLPLLLHQNLSPDRKKPHQQGLMFGISWQQIQDGMDDKHVFMR